MIVAATYIEDDESRTESDGEASRRSVDSDDVEGDGLGTSQASQASQASAHEEHEEHEEHDMDELRLGEKLGKWWEIHGNPEFCWENGCRISEIQPDKKQGAQT